MGVPTRQVTIGDRPAIDRLVTELRGQRMPGDQHGNTDIPPRARHRLTFCRISSTISAQSYWSSALADSQHRQDTVAMSTGSPTAPSPGWLRRKRDIVFQMPVSGRKFSRCFAGQSFSMKRPVAVSTFDLRNADSRGIDEILLADERPVFLRMERGSCELFLLALGAAPGHRRAAVPE